MSIGQKYANIEIQAGPKHNTVWTEERKQAFYSTLRNAESTDIQTAFSKEIHNNIRLMKSMPAGAAEAITFIIDYVISNNKAKHNPYHNTNHSLFVAETGVQLLLESLSYADLTYVVSQFIAGAFHDFNHSGGEKADDENIKRAIVAVQEFSTHVRDCMFSAHKPYLLNAVLQHSLGLIVEAIECTKWPFEKEPKTIIGQCLRDADLLQSFRHDAIEISIAPLFVEILNKPENRDLNEVEKLKLKENFLDWERHFISTCTFYTTAAKYRADTFKEYVLQKLTDR